VAAVTTEVERIYDRRTYLAECARPWSGGRVALPRSSPRMKWSKKPHRARVEQEAKTLRLAISLLEKTFDRLREIYSSSEGDDTSFG
jgi:hypothetical protein